MLASTELFDGDSLQEMFDTAAAELSEEDREERDLLLGAYEAEE